MAEIQKAYGENVTVFEFRDNFTSIVYSWNDEYRCPMGRVWVVNKNSERTSIFDQALNGYNGVFHLNQEDTSNSVQSMNFAEGDSIVIAFQYSGDEAEFANAGPSKDPADYFDWVIIYRYSKNTLQEILNYECA